MTLGLFFWIVFIVAVPFGGYGWWRLPAEQRVVGGASFIIYLLIGLLGWAVFGSGK